MSLVVLVFSSARGVGVCPCLVERVTALGQSPSAHLPLTPFPFRPGKYVLQWRWDCEETDQVWASCADVTVEA